MAFNLRRKIERRLKNFDRSECGRTLATEPVLISTQIWAERLLLMRVETFKGQKDRGEWAAVEEGGGGEGAEWAALDEGGGSEGAGGGSEGAGGESEGARELEEEAREQRERLWKRKESQMSSYSEVIQQSLQQRNRVRDRVLPAEELRAYINCGQWGCVLQLKVSMCIL
jgi:hypothetical protein